MMSESNGALSHLDEDGRARMVDVADKPVSDRFARARASVVLSPATCAAIAAGSLPKGDVGTVARLAGIQAAKRTAELVPLAHPLPLAHVDVELSTEPASGRVQIEATARTVAATGVELEALVAASAAAIAVYDMVKAVEPGARIEQLGVVEKRGGKLAPRRPQVAARGCAVVVVSTRAARGARVDACEPELRELASALDLPVLHSELVADDRQAIAALLRRLADRERVALVLTSGGTGLTSDDLTPEATLAVADRQVPGIAEFVRRVSAEHTPYAALSRGVAVLRAQTVIVNLPGSPRAVRQLREPLVPILRHALELVAQR